MKSPAALSFSIFTFLLAGLFVVPSVRASNNATFDLEEIGKISQCGFDQCLVWTIPEVHCTITDVDCQCSQAVVRKLTDITANCMYANCTITEALDLAKIQAALCDFPYETQKTKLRVLLITCAILQYGVIITRLVTRVLLGQQLGKDDYSIILVGISNGIFTICGGMFERQGFGEHIWAINLDVVKSLFLYFWVCELFYVITIALIKYSILFFYLRIFVRRSFRRIVWLTMGFCTASTIAFTFITVFQCKPIHRIWDREVPGTCMNYNAAAYANAGINIVQDFLILAIPIPEVRHLQLTRKQKVGMYGMFSVGGLVCIFSIIRLNSLRLFGLTPDPTWDNVNMTLWSTLETTAAIVCACMPSIRALGVRYGPKLFGSSLRPITPSRGGGSFASKSMSGIVMSQTTYVQSSFTGDKTEGMDGRRARNLNLDLGPDPDTARSSDDFWIEKPTHVMFSKTDAAAAAVGGSAIPTSKSPSAPEMAQMGSPSSTEPKPSSPEKRKPEPFHNTYNTKPTVVIPVQDDASEILRESGDEEDPYWDKKLPPTPRASARVSVKGASKDSDQVEVPVPFVSVAAMHVGERAARMLHSKFSVNR